MRPIRSVVLAAVTAWLLVVGVGSTAVWLVISNAGDEVGTADRLPMRAAVTNAGPLTPLTPRAQAIAPSPPRLHSTARPAAHPAGRHSATSPHSPASSPSAAAPSPLAAPEVRRTWQGVGGYVTARCRGTDIGLVAAQPDAGFVIAVSDRGPETLQASFTGRERESRRHSEVRAVCVRGVPRFEAHSWGTGGDE